MSRRRTNGPESARDSPNGMPSDAAWASQATAGERLDRARPYIDQHRAMFAGEWLRWEGDEAIAVVAFTGPIDAHQSALGSDVEVVGAKYSEDELRGVASEVARSQVSGVDVSSASFAVTGNVVTVDVVAADAEPFREEMRQRFGDRVEVNHVATERYSPATTSFESWSIDDSGRQLTLRWVGGVSDREESASVEESADAVTATIHLLRFNGVSTLAGYERQRTVVLQAPLDGRPVIDAKTGKTRREYQEPPPPDPEDEDWCDGEPAWYGRDELSPEELAAAQATVAERDAEIRAYVVDHLDDFGGIWSASNARGVVAGVSFSKDARIHRARLSPDIWVKRVRRPLIELERLQPRIAEVVASIDGCALSGMLVNPSAGEIRVLAAVRDRAADEKLESALRKRFSSTVDLVVSGERSHEPIRRPFDAWISDDGVRTLVLVWSDPTGGPAYFEVSETARAVRVALVESKPLRDFDPDVNRGRLNVLALRLATPLGDRAVIDATDGERRPEYVRPSDT